MSKPLALYTALSEMPRPRTYVGKFLLVAFIGVHVPLITVAVWVVSRAQLTSALPILGVMLAATLIGTGLTLLVQARLLAPLIVSTQALEEFVNQRRIPELPTRYGDEAGLLMRHTQHTLQHLDDLLRLKNDLLATLSHDARSPLTSIKLASQLGRSAVALDQPEGAELNEMFDIIDAASDRQINLMEDLLTMARSDSGKLTLDVDTTDPAQLVQRVKTSFEVQSRKKGVALAAEIPAGESESLQLDSSKTEQVLSNLVSNALKFTAEGGVVTMGYHDNAESLTFFVRDDGIGIPADVKDQLFIPFSSGQRAGTADESGTGLGLWICKTFVEAQGGQLELETQEGEGTEFRVVFPR